MVLARLRDDPTIADEALGFHAQQAIEKALKAVLLARDGRMRRTHDLVRLYGALRQHGMALPCAVEELSVLTPFAVEYRYGELAADMEEPLDRRQLHRLVNDILTWAEAQIARRGAH